MKVVAVLFIILLIGVVVIWVGRQGTRVGYESAPYKVVHSDGNEAKEKIPMTTPVFMSESESNRTMAFVMPAKLKSGEVSRPSDGLVTVKELAAGRFAVMRFSGGRNAKREAGVLDQLRAWMASEGIEASSPPVYGYFDPPWTPAFLRRNEVMLRTDPGQ